MKKIPVIYDVDTGLDDSLALFTGVNDPRFEVLAITATYGNTRLEYALRNSLNAAALLSRPDIPVAGGAFKGWRMKRHTAPYIHGVSGIGNYVYQTDHTENYCSLPAWDLIAEKCRESEEKVTIFVLGPCTNAANAIIKHPDIKEKIRKIIFMGGGFRTGAASQVASVNVYHDPEAFRALVTSGVPFYMCTSDQLTDHVKITPNQAEEAFAGKGELCEAALQMIRDYHRNCSAFDENGPDDDNPVILHDPACILYALDEDTCYTKKVFCDIELKGKYTYGLTVIDINDRLHRTEEEKNIHLVCAKEGMEDTFRNMFINHILNAGKGDSDDQI